MALQHRLKTSTHKEFPPHFGMPDVGQVGVEEDIRDENGGSKGAVSRQSSVVSRRRDLSLGAATTDH